MSHANRTEQTARDQIQEVAAENGGAGGKLFTWVGGHGLRRGPLQDAFFCQLTPGTSLGTREYVPAAVVPEPGPLLGAEPIGLEARANALIQNSLHHQRPLS